MGRYPIEEDEVSKKLDEQQKCEEISKTFDIVFINEKILESMGFVKIKTSSNPIYWILEINHGIESLNGKVVLGMDVKSNEPVWSLRKYGGDCYNFDRSIKTVRDLILAIVEKSFELGDRYRLEKIKKAIGR